MQGGGFEAMGYSTRPSGYSCPKTENVKLFGTSDTAESDVVTTRKGPNRKQRRKAEKEKRQKKKSNTQTDYVLNTQKPPVTYEQEEETEVAILNKIQKPRRIPAEGFHFASNMFWPEQDICSLLKKPLVNLQKIDLHGMSRWEINLGYFFQKFSHDAEEPKPTEFVLTQQVISFESIEQLQNFRNIFNNYVEVTPNFRLKIEYCCCRIGSKIDGSSGLVLIMALSSNNSMQEIIELLNANTFEIDQISIELSFSSGKLKQISNVGVLFGKSCEDNLRLCDTWKWKETSLLNWSELKLHCNQYCGNCSSLLFLVGLRRNITSCFSVTNVNFEGQRFFPSKFHGLARAIKSIETPQTTLKHPVLIKVWKLEVYFAQQTSFSTNPDVMSQSLNQLECLNITFRNVTLQVEVDSSGWGFFRINLTPSPIQVKFSNGVSIKWSPESTKETRLVAIETYSIPQSVINEICLSKNEKPCLVSPLLFIDQEFDVPFLKSVEVQMPFSVTESISENFHKNFKLIIYSKHASDGYKWTAIPESSVKRFQNYFIYHSTTFSPVVSVSSEEDSPMHASDFTANYNPIYLTVCPLAEREKINFDCRRLNEQERLQVIKVKTNEIKVVTDMEKGHIIHGEINGNLEIDLVYGYKLNEDGRLVFKYPNQNPVDSGNGQTYIMCLVNQSRYPEATITYYLSKGCVDEEEKLGQLSVQLQLHQRGSGIMAQTYLDCKTLGDILTACELCWSNLLEHLSIPNTKISEIQDHNSQDVLLNLQSKLNKQQVRKLFEKLFKSVDTFSIIDIDVIMERASSKFENDEEELYKQHCLELFRRVPRHLRQVNRIITCLEDMGLNGLVEPLKVITPGARRLASQECIKRGDQSDQKEFAREIARFLKSQPNPDCKNMAIDLLLKLQ